MEIVKTKKEMKEVEKVIERFTECDKCNKVIDFGGYDRFDSQVVCVSAGKSYPDGANGEDLTIDLCQDCAKELLDKLAKEGYRINKTDISY